MLSLESHAEAFVAWSQRHVKNRVLVHIDAHDDFLREVPPQQIARLGELMRAGRFDRIRKRLATGESELMDEGNFVFAASRVGLVREVYWVVAFGSRNEPGLEAADRQALREMGFSREQVAGFRAEGGRLVGRLHDVPLTVCGLADLPRIAEPVLLDIDVDLFSILASQNAIPVTVSLRRFAQDLRQSGLRFDLATIARSVEDGYTALEHAYSVGAVRTILASEQLDLPPDQWEALGVRGRAEALRAVGNHAAAIAALDTLLARDPDDAASHYGVARSYLELGRLDEALRHAERAARLDPVYELGLIAAARRLFGSEGEAAMRFLDGAEALAPASKEVHLARGDFFFERGEYRAALRHYSRLDLREHVGLARRMGDAYVALDEFENGLMFYEISAASDDAARATLRLKATSPGPEPGRGVPAAP